MIGISKLYCGTVEPSDALRYGRDSKKLPSHLLQFSKDKKPVVVWNMTRRCNLKCVHCYAQAKDIEFKNELSTEEGKALIDDLAKFWISGYAFFGRRTHNEKRSARTCSLCQGKRNEGCNFNKWNPYR